MSDINAPKVSSLVVGRNRVILQAVDKEIFETLKGSYYGTNQETGKKYFVSLSQDRSKDVFSGWMVEETHYLPEIPLNSEMWNIFGKVNYSDMTVKGTVQRTSSAGTLLGTLLFRGSVHETIVLQIGGVKGDFVLRLVQKELEKPKVRE